MSRSWQLAFLSALAITLLGILTLFRRPVGAQYPASTQLSRIPPLGATVTITATGTGCTARTMLAVSDTTQVTAVRPWTWKCWKVFKSAWIPAPAEQSEPAMVRTTGMGRGRRD